MEVAYAAQTLGAYAVPINWHFKAEEVAYILADCAASVLIGHADLLAAIAGDIPKQVRLIAAATPPEVATAYGLAPLTPAAVPCALDYEAWRERQPAYAGKIVTQPLTMFYTSGTTGHPKGVRRPAPTQEQMPALERMRRDIFGIQPGIRSVVPGPLYHSAPNAFAMRAGRIGEVMVLMPRFDPVALLELIARGVSTRCSWCRPCSSACSSSPKRCGAPAMFLRCGLSSTRPHPAPTTSSVP
jgi:long-chain acyl-CoA synthetase